MPFNNRFKVLTCIGLAAISCTSNADHFSIIESKPLSELWLNPGLYSYHFKKNKGLNNSNFGLGGEYRYSTVNSVTFGMFNNSDRQTSHYAGWYWQPIGLGQVRFGAVVGGIDGYPKMRNGGWFIAAIPTASLEHNSIGANLMFILNINKEVKYGSISLQLKIKLF